MSLPNTPEKWAINLSKIIKHFHEAHGLQRFPINVASIAAEYSKQIFPNEPITMVEGMDLSQKFEGALLPHPNAHGEWGIIYNKSISSKGRINFTLAHELGHYLLHRQLSPKGMQCSGRDMLNWNSEHGRIEAQANTFASFLLMPLDDVREQVNGNSVDLDLMGHLADRYDVSLTAAILKWLDMTPKRAMIVIGKDGFIDWAWCSKSLLKSGIFYKARQNLTALPDASLAARGDLLIDNRTGVVHPKDIWVGNEEVREMTTFSKQGQMSISLLLYPDDAPGKWDKDLEEPEELDTYDQFTGADKQSAQLKR